MLGEIYVARTLRRGHEHHLIPPPPEGCTIPTSFFHMFETAAAAAAKITRGSTASISNELLDEIDAERDAATREEMKRKFGNSVVLMVGRWVHRVNETPLASSCYLHPVERCPDDDPRVNPTGHCYEW